MWWVAVYPPAGCARVVFPYVVANLLADGADVSFIHLLSEVDNDAVEIGMRVKAVWKPEEEWSYAMDNIRYWKPLDNESEKGGK